MVRFVVGKVELGVLIKPGAEGKEPRIPSTEWVSKLTALRR